jgi:periplasmic divalent cation tolerance protein
LRPDQSPDTTIRPRDPDVTPHAVARRYAQLQTTIDSREKAIELVRSAVDARLAACGQVIGPVGSVYWWKGRVEETDEWLCLLKTRAGLVERLERFLLERHPYDVPEIVALSIERTSEDYGDWIESETRE